MLSMFYREIEPDPALRSFVTCYWEFVARDLPGGSFEHVVMPDGCVSIVYVWASRVDDSLAGTARWRRLRLVGPSLEARTVPVHDGEVFWGIRFWPGAAGDLLGLSGRQLKDRVLDAPRAIPKIATALLRALPVCSTAEEAVRVFDEVLLALTPSVEALDEAVIAGVKAIVAAKGEIKIGGLAGQLGLSERQFQRRFQGAVGLTPKQFARIRRFRVSMANALEEAPKPWGRVAVERGYADQPHLVREFSQLVGESPTAFAKRVRSIEHGPVNP